MTTQYCKICGEECFGLTCVDRICIEKHKEEVEAIYGKVYHK